MGKIFDPGGGLLFRGRRPGGVDVPDIPQNSMSERYVTFDIPRSKAQTRLAIYQFLGAIIMKRINKMPRIKTIRTTAIRKPKAKTPRTSGSHIEAHDYDEKSKTLTVTFAGGRRYHYSDVDPETAAGLAKAPSKGSFMRASVIGKFGATKL